MEGLQSAAVMKSVHSGKLMLKDRNGRRYLVTDDPTSTSQGIYAAFDVAAPGASGFVRFDGTEVHVRPLGTR
jgi:hypothetical protein